MSPKFKTGPIIEGRNALRVRIKIRDAGEVVDYEAVATRKSDGETIKISGSTYCDTRECVKQILRRALRGRRDPPEDVERAVRHIVDYVSASIRSLNANKASAFMNLPLGVDAELGVELTVYHVDGGEGGDDEEEYVGWYAEIRAVFSGYDGAAAVDGFHEFRKELILGGYLDDAAFERLTKELIGLARLAYNILPVKP